MLIILLKEEYAEAVIPTVFKFLDMASLNAYVISSANNADENQKEKKLRILEWLTFGRRTREKGLNGIIPLKLKV